MHDRPSLPTTVTHGSIAIMPLLIGIVLTVLLTAYPLILANAAGKANHLAACFAFWAMSAGYIRGVGFIPANPAIRVLFSGLACCLCLLIAVALIYRNWA